MNKRIFQNELAKIVAITKEFGAEKAILFGSCLEDIESAKDIDIAVSGVRPEKFFELYGKISFAVKDEVDLIPLEDTSKHFAKRVMEKGKLIYAKKV